ncbi:hypothetical protein EST38_g11568 [Candolleomyces aberdarensis]|uniref:Uncharacterized protein n=1 Tax=Candolleomyces aberdarensis TaxID=2316362 RepID=A0A4Q2D4I7_9AGAR|nr:hypothetical protein EST38_g11568 [Candolleomyces aberdarensis]
MPPLLTTQFSLEEFVAHMQDLLTSNQPAEFIKFALTGQHQGHQAVIDALQNQIYHLGEDEVVHPYTVTGDYDSVLGVSPNICIYNHSIVVNILPKFQDSLSKDVGITHTVKYRGVDHPVGLHHIPNLPFAKWMVRNELRIFFPRLWVPKQ